MEAKELMTGAWVINTEFGMRKIAQVEIVEPTRVWLRGGNTYVPIEYIVPIQITEEILERSGFVRYSEEGWHLNSLSTFRLKKATNFDESKVLFWVRISDIWVQVRYVHELQRVLRSCKIDVGFNLQKGTL